MSRMPKMKVIGVGGAGCNLIEQIIRAPVPGVEYFVVDDDCRRLQISSCANGVLLMGDGRRREERVYTKKMSMTNRNILRTAVRGAEMVVLVAGMGGSMGSVVTPNLAEIARKYGAFTAAVVCTPFLFEEPERIENTEHGMQALREYADTVITVPCEKQAEVAPDNTPVTEMIKRTDETIVRAVRLLSAPLLLPQAINLDYADIVGVLRGAKYAFFGCGAGEGEDMANTAFNRAIRNASTSIANATEAILYVEGGDDMMLSDINDVADRIKSEVGVKGTILLGVNIDSGLSGSLTVSILAVKR